MRLEQDMMCVLLKRLQDQGLISETIHDKARERILGTLDWPEYFEYTWDTAEGSPFAACANLSPQLIVSEEPQYIQYSDSSEIRFKPKSCAQSIKKAPSVVSRDDGKEETNGST